MSRPFARILKPVLAAIEQRGLGDQIDYIVYSDGFPYAVDVKPDTGGKPFPKEITLTASLTGLTFLHELVLAKDTAYLDLNANRYFRAPKIPRVGVGWTEEEQRQFQTASMLLQRYQGLLKERAAKKDAPAATEKNAAAPDAALNDPTQVLAEALRLLALLDGQHPGVAELKYNLACGLALQGQHSEAIETLKAAVNAGWSDRRHTESDSDLAALREKPEFKALLEKMTGRVFEFAGTAPFRHAYMWDAWGIVRMPSRGVVTISPSCWPGRAARERPPTRRSLTFGVRSKRTVRGPMGPSTCWRMAMFVRPRGSGPSLRRCARLRNSA